MLTRVKSFSGLKRWALAVAERRGLGRATGPSRKLAIVLHHIWINDTNFRFSKQEAAIA